jgi:hypothetical protein
MEERSRGLGRRDKDGQAAAEDTVDDGASQSQASNEQAVKAAAGSPNPGRRLSRDRAVMGAETPGHDGDEQPEEEEPRDVIENRDQILEALNHLRQIVSSCKDGHKENVSNTGGNRRLIVNALQYVSLAGTTFASLREQTISRIQSCPHPHFVVLLKQTTTLKYSGVYITNTSLGVLVKLTGDGPQAIHEDYINRCYKYDSAGKQWSQLPSHKLTLTTDAVTVNVKPNQLFMQKLHH